MKRLNQLFNQISVALLTKCLEKKEGETQKKEEKGSICI